MFPARLSSKPGGKGVFLITNGTDDIGRSAPLAVLGACGFVFNSGANDVRARISQNDGVRIADEWTARFYDDAKFQFVACQFKTKPIRTNN